MTSKVKQLEIVQEFTDLKKIPKDQTINYLETYATKMYKKYNVILGYIYELSDFDSETEYDNNDYINHHLIDNGMQYTLFGTIKNIAKYLYNENEMLKDNLDDIAEFYIAPDLYINDKNNKDHIIKKIKLEIKKAAKSKQDFINFMVKYENTFNDTNGNHEYKFCLKYIQKLVWNRDNYKGYYWLDIKRI